MAEIKSAIELAMEKTKNLVIDPKEREALALKEIEDKVKAVLRRYAEAMVDAENAVKELGKIQGESSLKRTIIIENLMDEFDAHKDNDRFFALFNALGIDIPQAIQDEFKTLNNKLHEELEAKKAVIRKNIKDILAEFKIVGSAIEPNIDAWEEWRKEVERVGDSFKKSLGILKDKIKATNKSL